MSAWRANDVVEYDAMRESATALTALLLRSSLSDSADAQLVNDEVRQLRYEVLGLDAYDRAAVSALARRIGQRTAELTGAGS